MVGFKSAQNRGKWLDFSVKNNEKSLLFATREFLILFSFQTYLLLRYGPNGSWTAINSVKLIIDRVKLYSVKLKEFLDNVTTVGLQAQYEAVTENLSLIAYLIQSDLGMEVHN